MIAYNPNKIMINKHEVDLATAAHVFYQAKKKDREEALATICTSVKDINYVRLIRKEIVDSDYPVAKDLCEEMEHRYELFVKEKVRTLDEAHNKGKLLEFHSLVFVVMDANYVLKTEDREYLVRLVQKSRASGINLVFMDARPLKDKAVSVNVPVQIIEE